jgi:hypothetical protein
MTKGIADPGSRIEARFKVTMLEEDSFPESVLYGLAIYRKKDGTVRCLQYLPREIGTMNINIPVEDGTLGKRLVNRNREHLKRLSEQKLQKATSASAGKV